MIVDIFEQTSVESSLDPSSSDSWQEHLSTSVSIRNSPSVKFAPLPQLAPWKRRSTIPLGIAARAQMMRQRREFAESRPGEQCDSPMRRGNDRPIQRGVSSNRKNRDHSDVEYSFIALADVVKGVWRRVSKKGGQLVGHDIAKKYTDKERHVIVDAGDDEDEDDNLYQIEDEECAWKDEGEVQFPEDISQTETLRDINPSSWSMTFRRDAGG
jgi:hypothetical protein